MFTKKHTLTCRGFSLVVRPVHYPNWYPPLPEKLAWPVTQSIPSPVDVNWGTLHAWHSSGYFCKTNFSLLLFKYFTYYGLFAEFAMRVSFIWPRATIRRTTDTKLSKGSWRQIWKFVSFFFFFFSLSEFCKNLFITHSFNPKRFLGSWRKDRPTSPVSSLRFYYFDV